MVHAASVLLVAYAGCVSLLLQGSKAARLVKPQGDCAGWPDFSIWPTPSNPIQKVLRTPDSAFADLDNYKFEPHYFETPLHMAHKAGNLRIHFVDEGPQNSTETVLLMHGEPTWSYLYRNMIPRLRDEGGVRVVAPDLVGFGKSDKPALREDHSYERHVDWIVDFVVAQNLQHITGFFQDWGGFIGLRVVARIPERFDRLVISNTGLIGGGIPAPAAGFCRWSSESGASQNAPRWGPIIQAGTQRHLTDAEQRAYDAPFPDETYKAATRVLPQLVPWSDQHVSVKENQEAARVLKDFSRPILTLWGLHDDMFAGWDKPWRFAPGYHLTGIDSKPIRHNNTLPAGHFVQEDCADFLVQEMLHLMSNFPVK